MYTQEQQSEALRRVRRGYEYLHRIYGDFRAKVSKKDFGFAYEECCILGQVTGITHFLDALRQIGLTPQTDDGWFYGFDRSGADAFGMWYALEDAWKYLPPPSFALSGGLGWT